MTKTTTSDAQATREILDANPGMLWLKATHASGQEFAVRFGGDVYEVLLICSDGVAVSVWDVVHFSLRFTLEGELPARISADLDQSLFTRAINDTLPTINVAA
jgi:hypothetical protein